MSTSPFPLLRFTFKGAHIRHSLSSVIGSLEEKLAESDERQKKLTELGEPAPMFDKNASQKSVLAILKFVSYNVDADATYALDLREALLLGLVPGIPSESQHLLFV